MKPSGHSQPHTSGRVASFYLQNKVKLCIPAQMKRTGLSFMFAKEVLEALRKQLETAASQTLPFFIKGQKVRNLTKTLRKADQRIDSVSNFIKIEG